MKRTNRIRIARNATYHRSSESSLRRIAPIVLAEESRLVRQLARTIVISMVLAIFLLVVFSQNSFTEQWTLDPSANIPPAATIAALGILAAIVIGLQSAVNAPLSDDAREQPSQLARQQVLEKISLLVGIAATTLGMEDLVWSALAVQPEPLIFILGQLAGGLLVAVLASDAAIASEGRIGPALGEARRNATVRQLKEVLRGQDGGPYGRRDLCQLVILATVALCMSIVTIVALDMTDRVFWASIALILFFFVAEAAVWRMVKINYLTRQFLSAALPLAIFSMLTLIVLLEALLSSAAADPDSLQELLRIPMRIWIFLTVPIPLLYVAFGKTPFSGRPGFGNRTIYRTLARRLDGLSRQPELLERASWLGHLTCICGCLVPPIGIPLCGAVAKDPRTRAADQRLARRGRLAGWLILAASVAFVGVMLVINPEV